MSDVYIIGTGQVDVARQTNQSFQDLGGKSITLALQNANISDVNALYVGNMLSGIVFHQQQLGPLIAENVGMTGVEAMTIEAACASGAAALHIGVLAIKSGLYDAVAICGIEIMSAASRDVIKKGLAAASDWETEGAKGETFLSLNAKMMKTYMDHYGVTSDVFANFGINAHKNAMTNPAALLKKAITPEDYANARLVQPPLRLYDICPVCDGAAALVLASKSLVDKLPKDQPRVLIRASAVATDTVPLSKRKNLHMSEAIQKSSALAFKQAGMTPADIDFFELHDAYSIISVLSLEGAGFAKVGRGFEFGLSGDIGLKGKLPISTFGGLKARGHPIGASGIYQCVEAFLQLTGQAKCNQVSHAGVGMCQSIAGVGGTVVTHILTSV